MHRFYIHPTFRQGEVITFPTEIAHQLHRVLRMRPHETAIAFDGSGVDYVVRLAVVERGEALGQIIGERPGRSEPPVAITLYQSLLKRDNFEWALAKCTEVGVAKIVPIISQRTIRHERSEEGRREKQQEHRHERWRRVIVEAVEQCERSVVPTLSETIPFEKAIQGGQGEEHYNVRLLCYESEEKITLKTVLAAYHRQRAQATPKIAIIIGPEGGFTEEEVRAARDAGWQSVSLGGQILRAETAGVVAAACILYEWR